MRSGLRALGRTRPTRVLIHDAVRPFVSAETITRVLEALARDPGAIAAVPLADTLKRAGAGRPYRSDPRPRRACGGPRRRKASASPTSWPRTSAAAAAGLDLTDDAAVAEWAGLAVALVPGSEANRKLTTAEDLAMAERARPVPLPDVRTGQGFDVHRFVPGDHVWLCGVRIPHTHALEGHSDADVALHALTDALLGAIGDGDIGQHFPDTDPRWKGAASHVFLAEAARPRAGARRHDIATLTSPCCARRPEDRPAP